ncbi:hypothetical protein [Bradyrhizobium sp. RT5a]|uniref:hypothetical protein n=1 Tax=unclassified Bradyrhizobium TaxID=2631580 RepID=UPI003392F707
MVASRDRVVLSNSRITRTLDNEVKAINDLSAGCGERGSATSRHFRAVPSRGVSGRRDLLNDSRIAEARGKK